MTIDQVKSDLQVAEQKAAQSAKNFVNQEEAWVKAHWLWIVGGAVVVLGLIVVAHYLK